MNLTTRIELGLPNKKAPLSRLPPPRCRNRRISRIQCTIGMSILRCMGFVAKAAMYELKVKHDRLFACPPPACVSRLPRVMSDHRNAVARRIQGSVVPARIKHLRHVSFTFWPFVRREHLLFFDVP